MWQIYCPWAVLRLGQEFYLSLMEQKMSILPKAFFVSLLSSSFLNTTTTQVCFYIVICACFFVLQQFDFPPLLL